MNQKAINGTKRYITVDLKEYTVQELIDLGDKNNRIRLAEQNGQNNQSSRPKSDDKSNSGNDNK